MFKSTLKTRWLVAGVVAILPLHPVAYDHGTFVAFSLAHENEVSQSPISLSHFSPLRPSVA